MNLLVNDVLQCENFGVPAENTTDDAVIALYLARGWNKEQAERHLQCAIDAGAYRAADDRPTARPNVRRVNKEQTQ